MQTVKYTGDFMVSHPNQDMPVKVKQAMIRFRPSLPPAKEGGQAYESVYEYEFTPEKLELPIRDPRDAEYFRKIKILKVEGKTEK